MPLTNSLATGQRSLGDLSITYPLLPPLTEGCSKTSTDEVDYPLEVVYDQRDLDVAAFKSTALGESVAIWEHLLPPLETCLLPGVGGTPLIPAEQLLGADLPGGLYLKDESLNPTWSHKDRLNICTVSAAQLVEAPGIVVASSGNHGASAAAMAARLGLPSVVVMSSSTPPAMQAFVEAYGAIVLRVPRDARWHVVRDVVEKLGYHPVSNQTTSHTGHPFGPEGYKTMAWEIHAQLGGLVPEAVFVPTGYAELFFGLWKGFRDLHEIGVADTTPRMMACEVASRGPLATAVREGRPVAAVEARPTDAYSMATTISGYRGVVAVRESGGEVVLVDDQRMATAQSTLGRFGLWQELSGASSVAGLSNLLATGARFDGPVVCICTSSGFKDKGLCDPRSTEVLAPDWNSISSYIEERIV